MMPEDFTIAISVTRSGTMEVVLSGELDAVTSPLLRDALRDAARRGGIVLVNMAAVTFVDSTALHTLLDADRALQALGGRVSLVDSSPIVRRLLELTGLTDQFAHQPATRRILDTARNNPAG